jgi:2'-5' RNA ligase
VSSNSDPGPAANESRLGEGPSGGPRQRLFFALWPDGAWRHAVEHDLRKAVRRAGGSIVPARNLHVTLVFLGSVDPAGAEMARAVAGSIRGTAFEIAFDRLEIWPRQRLLSLTAGEPSAALRDLAIELRERLRAVGFELERRPFRAHVTLARKVRQARISEPVRLPRWPVREFVLVKSVTAPEGSRYEVLEHWPLGLAGSG